MLRVAAALVGVVIVAAVAVFAFGGDEPELSPQDQSTPTATATAGEGIVGVRITGDGLDVEPLTVSGGSGGRRPPGVVTRAGRTLFLEYDNTTAEAVEVVFAHGAPNDRAAIQKALVTGAVIQAGDRRRDGVQVDPGRYTVLVRSPDETTDPTDAVSLQVR
jgi:hypothetical protein